MNTDFQIQFYTKNLQKPFRRHWELHYNKENSTLSNAPSGTLLDLSRSYRIQLDSTGFTWIQPDSSGFKRTQQDPTGFNQIQPDPTGFNRISRDPTGFNRIQPDLTGFNRIRPDSTGSNRIQPDSTGSNRIQLDLSRLDVVVSSRFWLHSVESRRIRLDPVGSGWRW